VDVAYITVYFRETRSPTSTVNWLSPVQDPDHADRRRERMLVWNDLEADEKLRSTTRASR